MGPYKKLTPSELRILDEIEDDICELIDENVDTEYSAKIFKAIVDATFDGAGTVDYKKAIVNLAKAVAAFLKMGASKGEKSTVETVGCIFYQFLDFYCFEHDHPMDEEKSDESEEK